MQPWSHVSYTRRRGDGMSQADDWVLLAYRLPRVPSTPRSAVWRKLKRLGVAQLGDGHLVADITPGMDSTRFTSDFTAIGGRIYFNVFTDMLGVEPWVSDGTADGTHLLRDVNPGTDGSFAVGFTGLGARVLFNAFDAVCCAGVATLLLLFFHSERCRWRNIWWVWRCCWPLGCARTRCP